ncbi:MAG: FAD-dependent oxidoreductase, partial [Pirellula sp.]
MVGGGLAGCAVAWQAHFRGLKVLLIDRQDPDSSSRVAAGLVTSITGTRAAAS